MKRSQAYAALIAAAVANSDPETPIDVADKLTKRALDMVKEAVK